MSDENLPAITDPVEQVFKFVIEGHGNADIIEYLEDQNIPADEAKALFEDALKRFVKAANLPRTVRRGWCLEAYRDLYRKLVSTGDYAGALRAVGEIAKLADVMPKKEDPPGDGTETLKDEIDEYIENVMAL